MLAAAAVATVVAVGDMACRPGLRRTAEICHQRAVGRLAESLRPDAFLALGDLQYEHGELFAFRGSYARAFGPLDPVARPVPGNHEYETPGARGYRAYFGARARMRAHV